jgi:hypothetical protein
MSQCLCTSLEGTPGGGLFFLSLIALGARSNGEMEMMECFVYSGL